MLGWTILIEQRFECFILELIWQTLVECLQRSAILGKAMIATDQMFQQPTRRVLAQLNDHFAQNHCHMGKSFIGLAHVGEANVV